MPNRQRPSFLILVLIVMASPLAAPDIASARVAEPIAVPVPKVPPPIPELPEPSRRRFPPSNRTTRWSPSASRRIRGSVSRSGQGEPDIEKGAFGLIGPRKRPIRHRRTP